jgi:hypothetical protein
LALDEALSRRDAQSAQEVKLPCCASLSIDQATEALGITGRTACRRWALAQAWLYRAIGGREPQPET